jgi:N-acetylglucosamine-6-phosphate deacetylase
LPTTVASVVDYVYEFLDNFHEAKGLLEESGPYTPGVHLEGPYFNMTQKGAQDPRYIKDPDRDEYTKIIEYGKGAVLRWSIAPELPGALEMGDYLAEKGIIASAGHTDAEYKEILEAFSHNYKLMTHFYSAMSTIVRKSGYRCLGAVESAYLIDDMDVEIIADGHHLPADLLKFIYKFKGPDRICLVTDSMRAAGMPEGDTILGSRKGGQKVIVEGGVAKLLDRSVFAGSVATSDRLVRVMHKDAGVDIVNAVKMITNTPARILGLLGKKGVIAPGADCDLVVFDEGVNIKKVFYKGKVI